MIYINTQSDFDKLLESVNPTEYSISLDGSLMRMYNEQRLLNAINESITLEAKSILENKSFDELKDAVNSGNWLKFVIKLIDALIMLIAKGIRLIAALVKKFIYRASDVDKSNKEFLSKYKSRLKELMDYTVNIDGYNMKRDLTGIAMSIENSSDDFFKDAVIQLTGGSPVFIGRGALLDKIAESRSTILNSIEYNCGSSSLKKDKEWWSEVRTACFGEKKSLTYSVADALDAIGSFEKDKNFIINLSQQVANSGQKDIQTLQNVKEAMKTSKTYSNKTELVEQFKLLNQYKSQVIKDLDMTFSVLMEYVDTINRQAKSICIIAMQEN